MTHNATAHTEQCDLDFRVKACRLINIVDDNSTCTRNVKVEVDAQVDPDIQLRITDGEMFTKIASTFLSIDDMYDTHQFTARRFYQLTYGAGDWNATFELKGDNGNDAWPYFAEIIKDDPPENCTNFTDTLTILPPP